MRRMAAPPRLLQPPPRLDKKLWDLVDLIGRWRETGASHVSINTMNCGLGSVEGHLSALAVVADALGIAPG